MGMLSNDVIFDHNFYGAEAGLIFDTREEGIEHFLRVGEKLGLNPSPYFMWSWVKQQIKEQTLEQYLERAHAAPLTRYSRRPRCGKFWEAISGNIVSASGSSRRR